MRFQTPLEPALLVRRYKRFLADMVLESDGREIVAHCPNPGAMTGLAEAGMRCWVEPNQDPKKKLKYGWRLVELEGGHWAGIDTSLPNRVVGEALRAGKVTSIANWKDVRAEVPYGQNSRVDFLLSKPGASDIYLEVKNVHLCRKNGLAEFPDSVTKRGAKHLGDLAEAVRSGHRAIMFYLIQRSDCVEFDLAKDIDPNYWDAFKAAREAGVEVLCYDTLLSVDGISLNRPIASLVSS